MPYPLASGALPVSRAGAPVRVMVVDDSVVVRGLMSRWLNDVPGITVISSQPNGAAALRELDRAHPDIVLLDIEMPEMDGITALPLMLEKRRDLVVIMASGLTQRNAEITLRALALGAKDYIPKPDSNHLLTTSLDFRRGLIEKITVLGAAARGKHVIARLDEGRASFADATQLPRSFALRPFSTVLPRVVAIGSSTGGPQALRALFGTLNPAMMRIPVLITQHMPPGFTAILAEQLGRNSGRPAHEARHGDLIEPGQIYVAPGG
ncbi:MAG TPA: chemotaxis protein CheB, partial [Hyphomicrobiales bacterium]|nr:chemotaxis protein CheB [Hyphomicrobiales bacterium]